MKKIFLLIVTLMSLINIVNAQWQQTGGPAGGGVLCSYSDSSNLYLGMYEGFYLSTDGGNSWQEKNNGLPAHYYSISTINKNNNYLYAGTIGAGVYRSNDNANSWQAINNGLPYATEIHSFAINDSNLYAGSYGCVYLSTDNGNTWSQQDSGLYSSDICSLLQKDSFLFAGTYNGIYLSTDLGHSWTTSNSGLPSYTWVNSITKNNNLIVIGTNKGIFTSSNNGIGWISISTGVPLTSFNSVIVSNDTLIAATHGKGIYMSADSGNTWQSINTGLRDKYIYSINKYGPTKIFAGTYRKGVFISNDNGLSWHSSNIGMAKQSSVTDLTKQGSDIYSVASGDLCCSQNAGDTWSVIDIGVYEINKIFIDSLRMYLGTLGNGIYTIIKNGINWNVVDSGLAGKYIYSITKNNNEVFAGASDGVYKSSDYGHTWIAINNGLPGGYIFSLSIANGKVLAGTENGVYYYNSNGNNWIISNNGLLSTAKVRCIHTCNNGDIYNSYDLPVSGYDNYDGGICRSTNSGQFWNDVTNNNISLPVRCFIDTGVYIFAGSVDLFIVGFGGVYFSVNNGGYWNNLNSGLINTNVNALLVMNNELYAGTGGDIGDGVWKIPISVLSDIPKSNYNLNNQFSVYPNPAHEKITIEIPGTAKESTLTILNINGQETLSYKITESKTQIDISKLTTGVYFVKLITDKTVDVSKVIIE